MRVITVSREFGSGGRELGRRLAEYMKFDYYDSEIITAIAANKNLDASYVENSLSNHGWRNYPITFQRTIGSTAYMQSAQIDLLLEQKRVIEDIAAMGKDFVIVGRNADVILERYRPFNIFVCAEERAKIRRCAERAPEGENLSEKELRRKMKQIDKVRAQTREILAGTAWGQRDAYHLTINTTDWNMEDLTTAAADFAAAWFGRK